ncbi:alpha/beta hydrolase [Microbacterium sp.]|uniref:alpha/beta hydrolase n=1 Tax=Microbacterium sp. TaxID=51671 RepID=UPI003A928736
MRESGTGDKQHTSRHRALIVVVVVLAALVIAALPSLLKLGNFAERVEEGMIAEPEVQAFYTVPSPAPSGDPGDVVRVEKAVGAPSGAEAWRILYHSTDETGADALVSGMIITPTAATAKPRTLVLWGHPTTGIAPRCAPSIGVAPFALIEGLEALLDAGFVVAAPDYSGMGMPGPPSFLLGDTEAANLLDIARATQKIPEVQISADLLLWGHSQGGHAALFAAQNAADYAPELTVLGVAVAAPATDLGELLKADIGDVSGVTIGAYAFSAYAAAYADSLPPDPLDLILTEAGAAAVPSMSELCLLGQNAKLHDIATPLIGGFISHPPESTSPWDDLLTANTPQQTALPMPLFVAQGESDTLVRPDTTAAYVRTQQAAGTAVTSHTYPGVGHGGVALKAIDELIPWMTALRDAPRA